MEEAKSSFNKSKESSRMGSEVRVENDDEEIVLMKKRGRREVI